MKADKNVYVGSVVVEVECGMCGELFIKSSTELEKSTIMNSMYICEDCEKSFLDDYLPKRLESKP